MGSYYSSKAFQRSASHSECSQSARSSLEHFRPPPPPIPSEYSSYRRHGVCHWFRDWARCGAIFQVICSIIGLALSAGTLRPAGPVALSGLDLTSNATWITLFLMLNLMSFIWGFLSIFKKRILKKLERRPVLFRFYFLISGVLMVLTNGIFGVAYITSVLNTPAGCQVTTTPGCSNVMAITATLLLWVAIEIFQLIHTIVKYRERSMTFEMSTRRKDEWIIWTRGFQFLCTSASAALAACLYIPSSPGIPVVKDVRTKFAWLLVLGVVFCCILCCWHFFLWTSWGDRKVRQVYGRYVAYIVMEVLVLVFSFGISCAYAAAFLRKGAPCNPLTNEGCFAILAMDAFVGLAVLMQIFQMFALIRSCCRTMRRLRHARDNLKQERERTRQEMELVPGYTFDQEEQENNEKKRVRKERKQSKAWEREEKDRRRAAQTRGHSDCGTRNTEHRHGPSDRHGGNGVRRWRSEVRKACPTRPVEDARSGRHRQAAQDPRVQVHHALYNTANSSMQYEQPYEAVQSQQASYHTANAGTPYEQPYATAQPQFSFPQAAMLAPARVPVYPASDPGRYT